MYSYDEYTLLRLRLGRWDPEFTPKPAQMRIRPLRFTKLTQALTRLFRISARRFKP